MLFRVVFGRLINCKRVKICIAVSTPQLVVVVECLGIEWKRQILREIGRYHGVNRTNYINFSMTFLKYHTLCYLIVLLFICLWYSQTSIRPFCSTTTLYLSFQAQSLSLYASAAAGLRGRKNRGLENMKLLVVIIFFFYKTVLWFVNNQKE